MNELLTKIGQRVGIIQTDQQRLSGLQTQLSISNHEKEQARRLHMLLDHSNACTSEIEYIMLITNEDPHPNHAIKYSECDHSEEVALRDGGYGLFDQEDEERLREEITLFERKLGFRE